VAESTPRPLHLHTLESLLADLVSGRAVSIGEGITFVLPDERARSALEWYRKRRATNWPANVTVALGEQLVDAIQLAPPEIAALPARPANANERRLQLRKIQAHRFAGLHKFGTPALPPADYILEFSAPITLFEGRNGSGKTSLANAIIWVLTGEILRAQREPERASNEFECLVAAPESDQEPTSHRLTPVTPIPDVALYRPDRNWVPADTWVELTFVDENGTALPPIRRSQRRTAQGRLEETAPDLTVLGIDPIAVRIGTVMPGLLPLIKVGHESELGRAVAQLTGLSALIDLAGHAQRVINKIKEFTKSKTEERKQIDRRYETLKDDLEKELEPHPDLAPPKAIPAPSDAGIIETILAEIIQHFETKKGNAFDSVRSILGDTFDAGDAKQRNDLEKSIGPALSDTEQPHRLSSMIRLKGFRELTDDELRAAKSKIPEILAQAAKLDSLARDPSSAGRARLYAHIATWLEDHPDPARDDDLCVLCGGSQADVTDPVSGKLIKTHIHDAKSDAALLSQTLSRWSQAAQGDLARTLPQALQAELGRDLPPHPCDLIRTAIIEELFAQQSFSGVLARLKAETASAFDRLTQSSPALGPETPFRLPAGCEALETALKRLDTAIRFAAWRRTNDVFARAIFESVLGRQPKGGENAERTTLTGKLLELNGIVLGAGPITKALLLCSRLKQELALRRAAQKRLVEYQTASGALGSLLQLGDLADRQVDELRTTLRTEAQKWRARIYVSSFPSLAHELVDTPMGRKGEVGLVVRAGEVSAPAQHIANASALRASLVGFFFAFWEHVLKIRGGLRTLVLDDPQELLDDENREHLAGSLKHLIEVGAQLVVTSYDRRFAGVVARIDGGTGVEHLAVHPATENQPVIRTIPHQTEILVRKALYDEDRNAEEPARSFADGCRVFFEAILGDIFDDPAHFAWAKAYTNPTLADFVARLRPSVAAGTGGMFGMQVFKDFVAHPALVEGSPVLTLMNKAHHGNRQDIRAGEVNPCANDLGQLVVLAGRMYEECSRWKRRDAVQPEQRFSPPATLAAMPTPAIRLIICPDLAAFTGAPPAGDSQDLIEVFDPQLLAGKCAFYLRRPNFGFAAPQGALAIVEAVPGPILDRRLVIARHGNAVYARRLLRASGSDFIGLTAEVPDPRTRSPVTLFMPEAEVSLHQVAGVLFDHDITVGQGRDEAVQVDASRIFEHLQSTFRVTNESAVPLALPGQIVLGGALIELDEIGNNEEALVALSLDNGSSVFKRIGRRLPGALAHLRQFESIGGLGSSEVLAIGKPQGGITGVLAARRIVGVIYHG
jgi:hypothetical protein